MQATMNHPSATSILLLLGLLVSGGFSANRIRDPKSNQCLEGFLSKTLRLAKCDSNHPPSTMTTPYQTWYVGNNGQISNAQIGQCLADGHLQKKEMILCTSGDAGLKLKVQDKDILNAKNECLFVSKEFHFLPCNTSSKTEQKAVYEKVPVWGV
jgi:hypothetical protein